MTTSYYRIQQADRNPADLLDPAQQVSHNWNPGSDLRNCPACNGRGFDIDGDCPTCDGDGQVENIRRGVSACETIDDLYAYIRLSGADPYDAVIVEVSGPLSGDQAEDADAGEVLVCPTEILSVTPVTDDIIARIYQED